MRRGTIYPNDGTNSISSDDLENHPRCSLTNILQSRRRGNLFLIVLMIIVFICGITIPLAVMLSSPNDDELLPPVTVDPNFNLTTNTTSYTLSTIDLNERMNSTLKGNNN